MSNHSERYSSVVHFIVSDHGNYQGYRVQIPLYQVTSMAPLDIIEYVRNDMVNFFSSRGLATLANGVINLDLHLDPNIDRFIYPNSEIWICTHN